MRPAAASLALFDNWAARYDESAGRPGDILEGYGESLREAAAMLSLPAGAEVLDVGIGTGGFAALFAEGGARVSGVDISPKMLERCQAAHPAFSLSLGSFLPIPHADGRFDAVTASFAFHEVAPEMRGEACRELARVLKPGGQVCLLDVIFASQAAEEEARALIGPRWDETEEYARVGDLDAMLRAADFGGLRWQQTAPCHWAVAGRKR